MAHTYVVQSQTFQTPGTTGPTAAVPDPPMILLGTVDGTQVTVNTWYSVLHQPTAIAYQNAVSPLMLAAWTALQPAGTLPPASLTWTQ